MLVIVFLLSACANQMATSDEYEMEKLNSEVNEQEQEVEAEEKEEAKVVNNEKDEEEGIVAQYRMNEKMYSFEPIADANPKVALLTIDDAPNTYALEMAKTLKALDAPAIFL
ncbi:hypothetical protein ACI2OX_14020 [Bacillus sp. N9]